MPLPMIQRSVASGASSSTSSASATERGGRRSIAWGALAVAFLLAAIGTAFTSTQWSNESRQLAQTTDSFELLDVRVDLSRIVQDEYVLTVIEPLGAATRDQVDAASREREQAVLDTLDRLQAIEDNGASTRAEARRFRTELESFTSIVEEPTADELYELGLLTEFAGEDARVGSSERTAGLGELTSLDQLVTLLLGEAAVLLHIQNETLTGELDTDENIAEHVSLMRDFIADAGGYLGPEETAPIDFAVIPSELAGDVAPRSTAAINARIRATPLWNVDQWIQAWDGGAVAPAPVEFGTLVDESFAARDDIRSIIDERLANETDRVESRTSTIATYVLTLRITAALLLALAFAAAWTATRSMRQRAQRLIEQANTDPLTGVGNRHMLTNSAEMALSNPSFTDHVAVMVDLDRFKMTNDTYGHSVGDRLLVAVAERLTALVDQLAVAEASVIRLGGDEFAVFLHHTGPIDVDRVHRAVESIRTTSVSTEDGDEITVELSYGVAHSVGPALLPELLDAADLEAYNDKAARRRRPAGTTIAAGDIEITTRR